MALIDARPNQNIGYRDLALIESPISQELQALERQMELVVVRTAVPVAWKISQLEPIPVGTNKKDFALIARKDELDNLAHDEMTAELNELPFHIVSVAGEGRKDLVRGHGIRVANGKYGKGGKTIWIANDVLENTTFAAMGLPGATNVLAVSEEGGLMIEPDLDYADKLFAPSVGGLSLDDPAEVTFMKVMAARGIRDPRNLTVTILNRPERNLDKILAAQRFGVNLDLVEGGDLTPAVKAVDMHALRGKAHIVMGIGGTVELILAAVAAREMEGFVQARLWHADPEIRRANSQLLTIDHLVPAPAGRSFLTFAHTTDDGYMNQKGVSLYESSNGAIKGIVNVTTVDRRGIRKISYI